jgi:pimeloyl-ACP methyl ester carboxylesterase
MQVIVDGLATNYRSQGDGKKTLVLLHGWGDDSRSSAKLQAELAKNYTVIAPDLPGFGKSDKPPAAWNLSNYAKFVEAFLKKLGINDVYALIGHSNGGAIAVRTVSLGLLNPHKMVLMASSGIRSPYNGRQKSLRLLVKAGKAASSPLPQKIKHKLRAKVYATLGSEMLVSEDLQETFKKIVTDDVTADAVTLTVPTLLVYGEEDKSTPPAIGLLFHEKIKDSTYVQIDSAGHFVFIDQPDITKKAIEDFLNV